MKDILISPLQPPSRSPAPERRSGWSQSGTLTSQSSGGTVGLQANFVEPGPYTVQFGIVPPADGSAVEATATVEWSVAGNVIQRQLTVGNGVEISAPAEAVKVIIVDATPSTFAGGGQTYFVSINVVRGLRANYSRPPILRGVLPPGTNVSEGGYLQVLGTSGGANDATGVIVIPPQAGAISVEVLAWNQNTTDGQPYLLVQEFSDSIGSTIVAEYAVHTSQGGFTTLNPSARSIQITNKDTVNICDVAFNLGIDG
jgi:hypothetical protein